MKPFYKKSLSILLCTVLILTLTPVPARALTLTAVNDTILPLNENTMPVRLGGELYVPYQIFGQLGVSSSLEEGVLNMTANGEALSFSPEEGYAYDQNMNSYSSPAYARSDTIYVPVKLCCGKFGLSYSTLSVSGETVLRLTDSSAQSDSAFTASYANTIQNTINDYKGNPPPPPPPNHNNNATQPVQPVEPPIPPVEEKPTQKPARIYLSFYGTPTSYTPAILDALHHAGRTATFFLPTNSSAWTDDAIRRIVAEGHTPALLLSNIAQATPAELVASLTAANRRLSLVTGVSTRIVSCEDGCSKLTQPQRDALIEAGYRLWDASFVSDDSTQSAARAYATTAQYFVSTTSPIVVRLHHSSQTPQAVQLLTGYMARQNIPSSAITITDTPINSASDTR